MDANMKARKSESVKTKKPITYYPPSQRSQITDEQARFFARLIHDLEHAWRQPHGAFRDLPEYERLNAGAYVCGLVCRDITPNGEYYEPFIRDPGRLEFATFSQIRRFVHFMMRGERHADGGDDFGGGLIYEALRCGALDIIANRLNRETDWREG